MTEHAIPAHAEGLSKNEQHLSDEACVRLEDLNGALWELKNMASIMDAMIERWLSLSLASKNKHGQYVFCLSAGLRDEILFATSDTRRRAFVAHADMLKALEVVQ
ncbi:hypothetical protein [Brucella pituitosa]|uniref:Uncharacterized protein n=1 Tax=Brucella pituitosa TaxID=571256 RepID=A0A643EZ43_9HYPH|nr:hypothetical protein [Brucella pituitosa]KAB0571075.1 hypothetical protein F7Q93_14010 [Brucella pituitosa]